MKLFIFAMLTILSQALFAQREPRVVYMADRFGYCVAFTETGRRLGFVDEAYCSNGPVQYVYIKDAYGYCVQMTASGRRIGFVDESNCAY